jgi:AAA15 family ATPase/GTPase
MENLIKALNIFMKYGSPSCPFHCEHDTLYICGINYSEVSEGDKKLLDSLGFFEDSEDDGFMSFRYGSC